MKAILLLAMVALSAPPSALSQSTGERPLPSQGEPTKAVGAPKAESVPTAAECDSDFDGAFLGAAIGFSPALLAILFHDKEVDAVPAGLAVGFIGGIVGFWAGLALDSRSCEEPE